MDTKGLRNAYIALNVFSTCSTDLCIANEGSGWHVYCQCPGGFSALNDDTIYPNASRVDVSATISIQNNNDNIYCTFNFYNSSNQLLGTEIYDRSAPKGTVYANTGGTTPKPIVRFTRFMSLIPKHGQLDNADQSYMTNARLTNLKLWNGSTSYTWDMSKLDYVWSMQGANITSLSISSSDSFSCIHRYQLHP